MNNKEKIADNTLELKNGKNDKTSVDNELHKEKKYVQALEDIKDGVIVLNKKFNQCADLLSLSVRGSQTSRIIQEAISNNMASLSNMVDDIEMEKENTKKRIKELSEKKDSED